MAGYSKELGRPLIINSRYSLKWVVVAGNTRDKGEGVSGYTIRNPPYVFGKNSILESKTDLCVSLLSQV